MLKHGGSLIIHTKRLVLRPYLPGDAQAMFDNWASDPEVTRYLSWQPHSELTVTEDIITQWVESYQSDCVYHWGITMEGELIGDISVVQWNERHEACELGYCLSRRYWGQGIMTEAVQSVMRYLFDRVGFHRIAIRHDIENPASGRVMQKAGLHYEGCLKDALKRPDGSFADICCYGAINGPWQQDLRRIGA